MTKKSISQNIDIDSKKVIVLIATFFIFFVLPIAVLNTSYSTYPTNVESEQIGRVAGVETTSTESKERKSTSSENSSDSVFMIIGTLSLSVTIILSSYLILSTSRAKKLKK
jgi:hypothetical protein